MLPRRMAGPPIPFSPIPLSPARPSPAGREAPATGLPLPGLPLSGLAAALPAPSRSYPEPVYPGPSLIFLDNPMRRFAALLLGFYLALHASYISEFLIVHLGVSLPVVAFSGIMVIASYVFIGRVGRFFQSSVSVPFFLMLVWWLLAAGIFSYKGYLIEMAEYAIRFHTAPLVFCGILLSLSLVRTAMTGYAWGFVINLIFAWRYGTPDADGRFHVAGTSMSNPNDLALNLLFGVAFMTIFLVDSNLIKRVFWLCCTLVSLLFVLRTGSRANLLTLLAMTIMACIISSGRVRAMVVAGSLLISLILIAVLPRSTWTRLTTFTSASSEDLAGEGHLEGAIGSTEARKNLQVRAIKITLANPIFGVGPKMFPYALDGYMRVQENQAKGTWQVPHNTYLDISAETGLPGAALYIGVIIWCLRSNYRNVRWAQLWPEASGQALGNSTALMLATVAYSFGTLFVSIPFLFQLPFLVGLTAANSIAMREAGLQRYPAPRAAAPVNLPLVPLPAFGPAR